MTNLAPETDLDSLTNQKKSKASLPGRGLIVVASIVLVIGFLVGFSPIALALTSKEAGMVAPWFLIYTLPLGALETAIGITVLIVGLVKSSRAKSPAAEANGDQQNTPSVLQIYRARLLIFVASPVMIVAWPVVGTAIGLITDGGLGSIGHGGTRSVVVSEVSHLVWPLAIVAVLISGIVLTVKAKARPAVAVPLYAAVGILLLLTIIGLGYFSSGIL